MSPVTENISNLTRGKRAEDIQSKSRLLYEKKRQEENEEVKIREFNMDERAEEEVQSVEEESPIKNKVIELTKEPEWLIESDAESDDILKSHFEN